MTKATESKLLCYANRQFGSALPISLLLVSILSVLAANALRTATLETQLVDTLMLSRDIFARAELGIATGLRFAIEHPDQLPATATVQVATTESAGIGNLAVSIQPTSTDNICPMLEPLAAERLHYEIRATVTGSSFAETTHIQGFHICREICTESCLGAESMPAKSYWTINDRQQINGL